MMIIIEGKVIPCDICFGTFPFPFPSINHVSSLFPQFNLLMISLDVGDFFYTFPSTTAKSHHHIGLATCPNYFNYVFLCKLVSSDFTLRFLSYFVLYWVQFPLALYSLVPHFHCLQPTFVCLFESIIYIN